MPHDQPCDQPTPGRRQRRSQPAGKRTVRRGLILASRSPSRAALLCDAGYRFTCIKPPYKDPQSPTGDTAEAVAVREARLKAASVAESEHATPDTVVLAADTVVRGGNDELLGTPANAAEATEILRRLVDSVHAVITAVAFATAADGVFETFFDQAEVRVGRVTPEQIAAYTASNRWIGKAGAYNLFDRVSDGWPITVNGDSTTVVGLPMVALRPKLRALGVLRGDAA